MNGWMENQFKLTDHHQQGSMTITTNINIQKQKLTN